MHVVLALLLLSAAPDYSGEYEGRLELAGPSSKAAVRIAVSLTHRGETLIGSFWTVGATHPAHGLINGHVSQGDFDGTVTTLSVATDGATTCTARGRFGGQMALSPVLWTAPRGLEVQARECRNPYGGAAIVLTKRH